MPAGIKKCAKITPLNRCGYLPSPDLNVSLLYMWYTYSHIFQVAPWLTGCAGDKLAVELKVSFAKLADIFNQIFVQGEARCDAMYVVSNSRIVIDIIVRSRPSGAFDLISICAICDH
jgi:hypothetical protein